MSCPLSEYAMRISTETATGQHIVAWFPVSALMIVHNHLRYHPSVINMHLGNFALSPNDLVTTMNEPLLSSPLLLHTRAGLFVATNPPRPNTLVELCASPTRPRWFVELVTGPPGLPSKEV